MATLSHRPFFTVDTPMKYTLWLAALFLLPLVNTWLLYGGTITADDLLLSAYASLLFVNPALILFAAALYAWRHGFLGILPWLFALAFVPAALVVYNDSALVYAIGYAVIGYAGQGAGLLAHRLWTRWRARSRGQAPDTMKP